MLASLPVVARLHAQNKHGSSLQCVSLRLYTEPDRSLVLVNQRDYPGSTPFSDTELALLGSGRVPKHWLSRTSTWASFSDGGTRRTRPFLGICVLHAFELRTQDAQPGFDRHNAYSVSSGCATVCPPCDARCDRPHLAGYRTRSMEG